MMMTAPAGTKVDLEELESNPSKYMNTRITVDAEVEEVLGPRLFTIDEPHWGDLDGEILVHAPNLFAVLVRDDDRITVTGTLKSAAMAEIKREWGWFDLEPEVEAEFARLNRDYDVTRERYLAFVDRAERAKLGDQAEQTEAVRFEIIDPPAAKFEPVAPKRPMLLAAVLIAGLGAGGGLAFLLHQLRPVFNSTRSLNEITGLPVLGVVSRTWIDRYHAHQRRIYLMYGAAFGLLLLVFGVVLQLQSVAVRLAQQLLS